MHPVENQVHTQRKCGYHLRVSNAWLGFCADTHSQQRDGARCSSLAVRGGTVRGLAAHQGQNTRTHCLVKACHQGQGT